jgi:hypothetical protein
VGEGVTIGDGVLGSVVGWLAVGDGVALAFVVVVPVCVDGVGLAGFAEVQPATVTRTLTSTSTPHIVATFRIIPSTSSRGGRQVFILTDPDVLISLHN